MLISIKPVVSRHDCVSKPCSASKAPAAASSCTFKVRLYRAIVLGTPNALGEGFEELRGWHPLRSIVQAA